MINRTTQPVPLSAERPPRRADQLPGPRGWPLLGNALQIDRARFHQQLEQWCREFGPLFKLRLGRELRVVVGNHETVLKILRERPGSFGRGARLEEMWVEMGLASGVFTANGDTWARQRRMVMAGFDPARVKGYYPALLRVAQRLQNRWQQAAQHGSTIDLQADLMRFTVDTIAGLAFGAQVDTLASDEDLIQQHLNQIFPALFKRLLSPVPTWRWWRTAADRALVRSVAEVNTAVAGFIAQARLRMQAEPARYGQPRNLLEAMIAAADQPDSGIDDQQVAGNVLTLLLAGEDTTANTLAWTIHLLWQHPQALERASGEVRRVLGESPRPTLEQLAALDYVEACAHEALRLKPVAPMLPLQALHDVTIEGVQVPAGTLVISLLRRDSVSENYLSRAASFEPERWLAEGGPSKVASAAKRLSMPFGAGPRICPGRFLAMLEMKLALATLLSRFDITHVGTADGQPVQEHLAFTMAPLQLQMRLRERQALA